MSGSGTHAVDAAACRTKVTPRQLAREWGVSPHTVMAWIEARELRAIDVRPRRSQGKPQYRIDRADILAFENRRLVAPQPSPAKRTRRKRDERIIEFYK